MADTTHPVPVILRRKEVEARIGLSRATIYELMSRGKFPQPIKLTEKSVGWLLSEVNAWLDKRIAASRSSNGEGR